MSRSVPEVVAAERPRSWGVGLVATWMVAVMVVLVGLAYRESRLVSAEWSRVDAALAAQPGWRFRHVLPLGAEPSRALLQHLLARGRLPGLIEELAGPMPMEWAGRLREGGWILAPEQATDICSSGGWLEIYAPDGEQVWRGAYQSADLISGAGVLREDLPLAAALAGRHFPPIVPALCAVTPAAPPRASGNDATLKPSRAIALNFEPRP